MKTRSRVSRLTSERQILLMHRRTTLLSNGKRFDEKSGDVWEHHAKGYWFKVGFGFYDINDVFKVRRVEKPEDPEEIDITGEQSRGLYKIRLNGSVYLLHESAFVILCRLVASRKRRAPGWVRTDVLVPGVRQPAMYIFRLREAFHRRLAIVSGEPEGKSGFYRLDFPSEKIHVDKTSVLANCKHAECCRLLTGTSRR